MQSESVCEFFKALLNSTQKHKQGAHLIVEQIKGREEFVLDTIEYLSSEEEPSKEQLQEYFHIITLLHPCLVECFPDISEKTQEDIRGGLLNCVVNHYQSLRCVQGLALLIRQIIEIDSLNPWMESISELLKWVASEDVEVVEAGIQFFIYVLKQTEYNQSNSDLPLHKVAGPLLEVLYQLFSNSELHERVREKLLYLVLQLVKTFSIFDGYNDAIVKQSIDPTFEIWMSFFLSTIQTKVYSNINIKRYIMKIIVIIFRDMQKYLQNKQREQARNIYTIWQFCYKVLEFHIWGNVWEKPIGQFQNKETFETQQDIPTEVTTTNADMSHFLYYDDDSDSLITELQSLSLTLLQFLSVLTSIPQLNTTIKISIHHLTNSLFHFMMMPETESQNWSQNPQQFLIANSTNDYEITIRNKTLAILNELIEKCGDYAIQAILMVGEKFLLNLPQKQTTNSVKEILQNVIDINKLQELSAGVYQTPQKMIRLVELSSVDVRRQLKVSGETWRKMEVALVVLARFAEDIIVFQSKQQAAFDIESFVNGLVNQINDEDFFELLKGQSLYCLTRFTEIISIKYRHIFTKLVGACVNCLNRDNPISVKVIAARALTLFLRKIDKHKLKFSEEQSASLLMKSPIDSLIRIPLYSEVTNHIIEALIELSKNQLFSEEMGKVNPEYLLTVFHKNIDHSSTMQLFFTLLEEICSNKNQYVKIINIFTNFIQQCLKSYCNIIESVEQKEHLKNRDIELILLVLKISNVLIVRGIEISKQSEQNIKGSSMGSSLDVVKDSHLNLLVILTRIVKSNEDIQVHIQVTVCLKNLIKLSAEKIRESSELTGSVIETIKCLLKIPKDKTFESASLYAGNLVILTFELLLTKMNYEVLQEAVLKVFRSRTPSVIQSLVLIYSSLINKGTEKDTPFEMTMGKEITQLVDFLASFSIENRMGLKILIDKWLLQQSLFRGKYAKISTFMALSKLFLLGDKRIDNLLVIGFNPSHTTISNDVTAPLKILATLIRCLDNEKGFQKNLNGNEMDEDDDQQLRRGELQDDLKEDKTLDVNLQKFREEKQDEEQHGGLADRENQQGSTCYMSAMLEFYDDGEECDETTEEDLLYLGDSSTEFELAEYLTEFFNYLMAHKKEYFKECLKGIMKQDVRTLEKYVKID